jgi:hypothetical protein
MTAKVQGKVCGVIPSRRQRGRTGQVGRAPRALIFGLSRVIRKKFLILRPIHSMNALRRDT